MLWVDIAKALGIYLIVLSHYDTGPFAESFLWTFHVPLFFFVSGYLARAQPGPAVLAGVARRLVVPYVGSYVVIVLITAVLESNYDPASILRSLAGIVYGTHAYPYFANAALWFLPSLITIELLYAFCIRRFPPAYLLCLAVSYVLYRRHALDLFFSIDLSLLGLSYFLAGVLVRRFAVLRALERRPLGLVALLVASTAATAAAAAAGNVWYAGEVYAQSLGAGLAGIAMVVAASMLLAPWLARSPPARAVVVFVSSNTLFVLCYHVFSNPAAAALLAPAALAPPIWRAAVTGLLSMALLVPANLLVRRFVPALIGLRRTGPAPPARRA